MKLTLVCLVLLILLLDDLGELTDLLSLIFALCSALGHLLLEPQLQTLHEGTHHDVAVLLCVQGVS